MPRSKATSVAEYLGELSADRRKAICNAHWTHLESGNRRDVLKWFAERQDELG